MIPSLRQDGKIIADLHFDFAKMIFCFFLVRKDFRKIVKDNFKIKIGCFFTKNSNACRNANILHGGTMFFNKKHENRTCAGKCSKATFENCGTCLKNTFASRSVAI